MAQLKDWQELPPGGLVTPADALQPRTGDWRTAGRPVVHYESCINCLLCWLYCPDSAVELDGSTLSGIDYDFCKGCELCVEVCPTGALVMTEEAA
ncbi:MAG TPA: 4Fe-4S binding protein [Gaiellaceae bacterium]|nr:4Fe-4S binding protein [Gaiellaceae bacterium]